jgi:hypothetical protein
MKTKSTRIISQPEGKRWFVRGEACSIDMEMLVRNLTTACGDKSKVELWMLQEARDIIETLLLEDPSKIIFNHTYSLYEMEK